MREWFTPENIAATLRSAERNGVNTHQLSYLPEAVEQMAKVKDFFARVRDSGVLAGMSSHLPENIAYAEEHGWDVVFYMASFHQLTRSPEETRKLTGEMGIGTTFLQGDPARMCKVIRAVKRPCLAFKILAAGRMAEKRGGLEEAFRFAFENIKPTDAVIVGVYPRFKDEVAENAAIVRRLLAS